MVSKQVVKLTSWVRMAPKKNRKLPQDPMVGEAVDDLVAPPESIGEEEPMPREDRCRNPSFGLATKAKGLQGCGPRGSPGVTS